MGNDRGAIDLRDHLVWHMFFVYMISVNVINGAHIAKCIEPDIILYLLIFAQSICVAEQFGEEHHASSIDRQIDRSIYLTWAMRIVIVMTW